MTCQCEKLREALERAKNGVQAIQRHVEAGGANEELTAATIICSQVIEFLSAHGGQPCDDEDCQSPWHRAARPPAQVKGEEKCEVDNHGTCWTHGDNFTNYDRSKCRPAPEKP